MKFILNTVILSIFVLLSNIVSAQNITQSNEAEILDKILKDYNPNYQQNDKPTEVGVNTYIRQILDIDTVKMQFTCQLTFRMQWTDQRLKYENDSISYLTLRNEDSIFVPDIYFTNSVSETNFNLIKPNVLIQIYPDGKIYYSKRIQLVLSCPFNLKYFPFDKQKCVIKMASYAYATDSLILIWKEIGPVQVTENLYFPNFSIRELKTGDATSKTNTGEYSAIYISLLFEREFNHYLMTIFTPSTMLVIISWLSFFLSPKDQIIKVMICLISLFLLILVQKDVNNLTQPVGYTKASDVWMGTCLTFVFAALMESVLAINSYKMYNNRNINIKYSDSNALGLEKIDYISFILFFFLFIFFSITYSITYCFN